MRKSKGFRKGAKKGRWFSFLVRALSTLSHAYLARYPSYGPVIQARNRLEMGGVPFFLASRAPRSLTKPTHQEVNALFAPLSILPQGPGSIDRKPRD